MPSRDAALVEVVVALERHHGLLGAVVVGAADLVGGEVAAIDEILLQDAHVVARVAVGERAAQAARGARGVIDRVGQREEARGVDRAERRQPAAVARAHRLGAVARPGRADGAVAAAVDRPVGDVGR